jgi:NTP pyrophosphatase (non-canonical NTP hydrolase)
MSIEALEKQVIKWAWEKGIFPESTRDTRFGKFIEEVEEFTDAMYPDNHDDFLLIEAMLEAGDVLVTLINVLYPMGLDLETCLAAAYDKIKDRTGKMIDGQYVRDREA